MIFVDVLLVIVCCTCLQATPIYGAVVDDCSDEGEKPDFRSIREQLDHRIRALFGSFRIGGGGLSSTGTGSRMTDESSFFRNGFKLGRHRGTNIVRPRDAENGDETTATEGSEEMTTTTTEDSTVTDGTTATDETSTTTVRTGATADRRVKFATESECASANGGRPCVCFVADLLARLLRTDETPEPVSEFECPSYVAAPKAFVTSPAAAATAAAAAAAAADTTKAEAVQLAPEASSGGGDNDTAAAISGDGTAARRPIDFEHVVHYSLLRSKNDYYTVHYGLVSSDLKIKCLQHMLDGDEKNITNFKWDATAQHKSNSTVTGLNTNTLMILGLDPKDSNNYTCVVSTIDASEKTTETSYKHHVIVVERPLYEIHGTAFYLTSSGGCKNKTIYPVRKQLPSLMLSELCPDGTSGYACNVVVETFKCTEDQNTLEIGYSITQNDNLDSIIKSTKKSHNALHYQKMIAGVSGILAENLYKMLTIPIVSKYSLFNTNFKPDHDRAKIESFVDCPPGFGIREIFCAACPPHHYSPNTSADCLKCPKGFHQPVSGSDSCVKCSSIFADGCFNMTPMKNASALFYYTILVVVCLFIPFVIVTSCAFCCREEGENKDIKIIPRQIRKKFKRKKGYKTLKEKYDTGNETDTSGGAETTIEKVQDNEKLKRTVKISEPIVSPTYKTLAED